MSLGQDCQSCYIRILYVACHQRSWRSTYGRVPNGKIVLLRRAVFRHHHTLRMQPCQRACRDTHTSLPGQLIRTSMQTCAHTYTNKYMSRHPLLSAPGCCIQAASLENMIPCGCATISRSLGGFVPWELRPPLHMHSPLQPPSLLPLQLHAYSLADIPDMSAGIKRTGHTLNSNSELSATVLAGMKDV